MSSRKRSARSGEIEFSDEERAVLGIEVVSPQGPHKRRPSLVQVPMDEVPRTPSALSPGGADARATLQETLRQHAFSPTDLLVEAAFEHLTVAPPAARPAPAPPPTPAAAAPSPAIPPAVPALAMEPVRRTASTPPPLPAAVAAATPLEAPPAPPPTMESPWDGMDDGIARSTAGNPPASPAAAAPPSIADLPTAPTALSRAQTPSPADAVPEAELVVSSSPAPDASGPRVAVAAEASGRVSGDERSVAVATPAAPAAPHREGEPMIEDDLDLEEDSAGALPLARRTTQPMPILQATASPQAGASASAPQNAAAGATAAQGRESDRRTRLPTPPPLPAVMVDQIEAGEAALRAAPTATEGAAPQLPLATPLPSTAPPPPLAALVPPPTPAVARIETAGGATEERPRRKRRAKQWFEEIFDEDYLCTLPYMTPRQTERESAFILEALRIQPEASAALLDVGCGYGRHAMELAARGHKVTGLDLSLPLLIRAADAARRAGVNVNFVHGDMRELAFEAEFDAAFCVFTSFGYFDDDTNRKVAAQIAAALKPGGRFFLDVINRDYLIGDLPTRVWWQGEGCVVLEEVDFNYFTSRLMVHRSIVFEDGRQSEQDISIRAYSLHEIGKILHHAGFRVVEVSGGLSLRGKFFGTESRQILVVAEKKEPPAAP